MTFISFFTNFYNSLLISSQSDLSINDSIDIPIRSKHSRTSLLLVVLNYVTKYNGVSTNRHYMPSKVSYVFKLIVPGLNSCTPNCSWSENYNKKIKKFGIEMLLQFEVYHTAN